MNAVNKNHWKKTANLIQNVVDMFAMSCNEINVLIVKFFQFKLIVEKNNIKNHLNTFFNFHIEMHFAVMMNEYEILWNINVLFKKKKHRFFKQNVFTINNRKSKKQFFFQKCDTIHHESDNQGSFFSFSFSNYFSIFENSRSMFRFIEKIWLYFKWN